MATTSNFGWTTPDDTDLVKDGALAIRTLGNNIDNSLVDLKGGTTGQVLSKNSNTDLDYTWVTPNDADAIQNTIVDAKGDLISATAADTPARLASSGVNGDILTVDTSTATGLKWAAPAASSPLTTKGDLYSYSTTNARLGVGANGETLVADSSQTTGLRYNPLNVMANPVINGGFDIWQRGTSFAINNIYTADRWVAVRGGNVAGMTVSRQTTGDTTNLPNIQYAARMQRDSGNSSTNAINMGQWFESVNSIPYAGKTVTLSFYARKGANYSAASDVFSVKLQSGTGTDQNGYGAYTGAADVITVTATLTSTWQRFAGSGTIGATATEIGVNTSYTPVGTAGANDWVEITGVQIDFGTYTASTAPTFRRSGGTLAGELQACKRYYTRVTATGSNQPVGTPGVMRTTAIARIQLALPVTMRVAPTSLDYSGLAIRKTSTDTSYALTAFTLDNKSTDYITVDATIGSTFSIGDVVVLQASTNEYWGVSAEL